jgi:hypothetical protein
VLLDVCIKCHASELQLIRRPIQCFTQGPELPFRADPDPLLKSCPRPIKSYTRGHVNLPQTDPLFALHAPCLRQSDVTAIRLPPTRSSCGAGSTGRCSRRRIRLGSQLPAAPSKNPSAMSARRWSTCEARLKVAQKCGRPIAR